MKKLLPLLLCLTLAAVMLVGCATTPQGAASAPSSQPQPEPSAPATTETGMRVTALNGPTAMGMVKLMDDAENGAASQAYTFAIQTMADEVTVGLTQGRIDVAALPANAAAALYNNAGGEIQVLAINTLGVLYVVENGESIGSVEDLRGKTLYATGKGTTPEYALNYVLSQNGIDPAADVTIEWQSEAAACLAALSTDQAAVAMLPQPFVTTALKQNDGLRVALDLTEEWDAIQAGSESPSALITGVVVARRDFIEQNPEAVSAFLDDYQASVEYVNANVDGAAELVGKYGIVTAEVAKEALPSCNITFIEGNEMKQKLSGYLSVLLEQNPQSIGGVLPGDAFYYSR